MLTNSDVDKFIQNLGVEEAVIFRAMAELEQWVVDDEPGPQERIQILSEMLSRSDVQQKLPNLPPEDLVKAMMHMNGPRYAILLRTIGEHSPDAVGNLIINQGGEFGLYVVAYLLRLVFLIKHKMHMKLFSPQRRREILELVGIASSPSYQRAIQSMTVSGSEDIPDVESADQEVSS